MLCFSGLQFLVFFDFVCAPLGGAWGFLCLSCFRCALDVFFRWGQLMKLADYIGPMKQLDVFSNLTDDQIVMILNHAEWVSFRPGQVVIEDGQVGDAAYFITMGLVERLAQPDIGRSREHFGHGILVGEMAMLVDHVHSSTVRAKSEVRALKISRHALYTIMSRRPEIADVFIQTIKGRLDVMIARIKEIDESLAVAEHAEFDQGFEQAMFASNVRAAAV